MFLTVSGDTVRVLHFSDSTVSTLAGLAGTAGHGGRRLFVGALR